MEGYFEITEKSDIQSQQETSDSTFESYGFSKVPNLTPKNSTKGISEFSTEFEDSTLEDIMPMKRTAEKLHLLFKKLFPKM